MFFQALQKVFRKPIYTFLAFSTSVVVFAFAVWLPNISLIVKIMGHREIPFTQKLDLPINLLGSIATNFTLLSALYTIAIAILFGINLAMIIYFLGRRITEVKQNGIVTGFLGLASGVIGIGCVACGSLVLSSILSLFGATWILSFMPFAGGEFGILGIILLLTSIYIIAKRIDNPLICKIVT